MLDQQLQSITVVAGLVLDKPGHDVRGVAVNHPEWPRALCSDSFRRFTPVLPLLSSRRRPGSISAVGTGLRRCDKVVVVSVEPATLQ